MEMTTMRVISADIPLLLRIIERESIALHQVKRIDELTLEFLVPRRDEKRLRGLFQRRSIDVKIIGKSGVFWRLSALFKRPVLVFSLILLILSGFYLPTRVWFFEVEGNHEIPRRLILEAAEDAGLCFGASAKQVRNEKIKNAILEKIPQLQWVGVNTSGCVATIRVKERAAEKNIDPTPAVSSIVAVRDGIICDMTVTSGTPLCKVGQAVSAGETLISGYGYEDQLTHATRATGEVFASTNHKIEGIMPLDYTLRGEGIEEIQKFSIIFGKKRINFYSGSGILDSSCVKMYEEKYLTLPGGFQLPIVMVKETWITCREQAAESIPEQNTQSLSMLARRYLKDQMIAGTIHSQSEQFSIYDDVIFLTGEYGCIEMIGREKNEEIIKP